MGFLDDISKTIADVGQTTFQKGKGMVDVAKYNSMISDEERKISKLYEEIGRKFIEKFPATSDPAFAGSVSAIAECQAKIEEYKKEAQTLRGITQCPKCGAEVPAGSAFCAACGQPIETASSDPGKIKCSVCGAEVPLGCKFCTSCGTPIA